MPNTPPTGDPTPPPHHHSNPQGSPAPPLAPPLSPPTAPSPANGLVGRDGVKLEPSDPRSASPTPKHRPRDRDDDDNDDDEPEPLAFADSPAENPAKRRKLAADNRPSPRPPSPPWKAVAADGPTSFVQDGRRRSGRTNLIPLELQPQAKGRQTRAAYDKSKEGRARQAKPTYNVNARPQRVEQPSPPPIKRPPSRPLREREPLPERPRSSRGDPAPKTVKDRAAAAAAAAASATAVKKPSPPTQAKSQRRTPSKPSGQKDSHGVNALTADNLKKKTDGVVKAESDDDDHTASTSPLSSAVEDSDDDPPLVIQKVTFRVRLPNPSIQTPENIPRPKKFVSFEEFLEKSEIDPPGQDTLTPEQIQREAEIRMRVRDAQGRGGTLSRRPLDTAPEKQPEPPKQHGHWDHMLGHIIYFRRLLRDEIRDHRRQATILAHEAKKYVEEKRKRSRVKTAEEIEREKRELALGLYRTVVKDVDKLWLAVKAEVDAKRLKEYEEQQQAKMKGHLARVLDRTDQMLNRHSVAGSELDDSEMASDQGSDISSDDEGDGGDESESEDSDQMSESETESESEQEQDNPDAEMSLEELKRKYENLPNLPVDDDDEVHTDIDQSEGGRLTGGEDDSDPDTEMDSEFDTEDSDDEGSDADEEEDDEDEGGGLMSLFFSKKQIAEMAAKPDNDAEMDEDNDNADGDDQDEVDGEAEAPPAKPPLIQELEDTRTSEHPEVDDEPQAVTSSTNDAMDLDAVEPDTPPQAHEDQEMHEESAAHSHIARLISEDRASQEPSAQTSPHTTATKVTEPESVSSIDAQLEQERAATPAEQASTIKTPVPSLLRGTLREYQHEGLDWLADLYANGRSGILADEMGLGKTIQSISLLAHLAEVHQVWGPHLIVVPTSVMLNWEMEFKKFLPAFKILTYYGSIEERRQKRRGWMADDSFNVCITSYQLVLQDANSFKRRRWHYMILDEAHNIKNFRSERWQTMMTFNTRARLLLTGTPLQNNLTELWSLLFFLHYGQENEGEDDAFAGLKEWSEWFRRPVESILEHGRQVLDEEDKEQVAKLHKVIRPFLLRRLKRDVEKQMPLKYEHVEMCRLSKRQRQLYDGFMSRAQTKETLASGNYLSIINALMQLRKVCNHPDLFETRPINTSLAMPNSVASDFEINDLLVRRRFLADASNRLDLDFLQLAPISDEGITMISSRTKRHAYQQLKQLRDAQLKRIQADGHFHWANRAGVLGSLENVGRKARLRELDQTLYYEAFRHHQHPVYGRGLIEKLTVNTTYSRLSGLATPKVLTRWWDKEMPIDSLDFVQSIRTRSDHMEPYVQKFGCVTPAVVATDLGLATVTEAGAVAVRESQRRVRKDPFHEAQMKLSIAFPDKRLLQYDCGKLQRLDKLLRQLQSGGHRALIFTQMTKVLDILEQFLNIHGHRYLRLDGATKIEQRQILTDRFNNDNRILCFILSSRSGGLGINLTGADTVIFYDLDWNPAMDKQCTDRAHRIGQTRDVHIYRFVSEHTIESNILRKANQKQLLDDVVIQEGDFTTDYMNRLTYQDMLDDGENDAAGAAMDRVLGNDRGNVPALEQAEDQEDRAAAKVAAREVQHADDGDFEDKAASATPGTGRGQTPAAGPFGATEAAMAEADAELGDGSDIDDYMVKLQTWLMKDIPLASGEKKRKRKRDEHRIRRR